MRILLIHSDYIKYKTKSKTKIAEEITNEKKEGEFKNSLVVFTAVEKKDEKNTSPCNILLINTQKLVI